VLRHAIHFGLQLLYSDRALPVIFEHLRLAQIIFDFLFELRLRHHRIQRRLGIRVLPAIAGPDPVTPVNVLDRSLIGHTLCKGQRSLGPVRRRFGTEEAEFTRRGGECSGYDRTRRGYATEKCDRNAQTKES
jgi:hypothetical protein